MLRRLPRALLVAGRRSAGGPAAASGRVERALHAETSQRSSRAADGSSSWVPASAVAALAASAALASPQTFAAEAVVAPAKQDPASTLKGLKRLSDAKEVVLYQYEVCPFCNKVRRERCCRRGQSCDERGAAAAQGLPGLPRDSVQGCGGEPAHQEGAEVVHIRQGESGSCSPRLCHMLRVARPQVPVLVVDGEQLNDSSFIIKALSAKLEPGRGKGKAGKLTGQAAAEEEEWFRRALRLPAVPACARR